MAVGSSPSATSISRFRHRVLMCVAVGVVVRVAACVAVPKYLLGRHPLPHL